MVLPLSFHRICLKILHRFQAVGFKYISRSSCLKKPIQITYYLTRSIVGLLVVFCAIWFGFYLAKSISIPIKELAEGTRRVAEGDFG